MATLGMAALSGMAGAQTPAPVPAPGDVRGARIDQRQTNQDKRIDQGVQSGQLSARETARLERGQARVQGTEDKARADGKITKKEAHRVEHA